MPCSTLAMPLASTEDTLPSSTPSSALARKFVASVSRCGGDGRPQR